MSSLSKTPNLNLPQFNRDDRPAWVGDITPAFSAIDTAIGDLRDKTGEIEGQFPGVDQKISGVRADMTELVNNTKQELNQSIAEADVKIEEETERATTEEQALSRRVVTLENNPSLVTISTVIPNAFISGVRDTELHNNFNGLNMPNVEVRLHDDSLRALFPEILKDDFTIAAHLWNASVMAKFNITQTITKSGNGVTFTFITRYNNSVALRIFIWGVTELHAYQNGADYVITLTVDKKAVRNL